METHPLSNTREFLGMSLMPTMHTLRGLLTARATGEVSGASSMNMPYTAFIFYVFNLEPW
jgi:hypothetical protein